MAGHSKWANIKHKKAITDAKKGKAFTRLIKEVTVAARMGGGDPAMNPRLRLAIDKARDVNMPKDNIDRAIKKGVAGETDNTEEIRYEGFGHGGVGIIVEVLTDNRNRAAANVRTIFGKNGGNLGESGSVAFMFDRLGQITYPPSAGSEDAVMEAAIEAGAQDVESNEDGHLIFTAFEDLSSVTEALSAALGDPKGTAIVWKGKTGVPVSDDDAAGLMKLLDALDDDDDVANVFTNVDLTDAQAGSEDD
jgi:YebC/PmpR family DNA-binding regulatory protein